MRSIMVLNAKGGCGKSTLATNLAAYYATEKGKKIATILPLREYGTFSRISTPPRSLGAVEMRKPTLGRISKRN